VSKQVKDLVLEIEDLKIPVNFLVIPGTGYEILLGREFLQQTKCRANFDHGTFMLEWHGDQREIRATRVYKIRGRQRIGGYRWYPCPKRNTCGEE
jgi:hypothetical protein